METEKSSPALLTPPDPVDHYAELLRIRQKGARRDFVLAYVAGAALLVSALLFSLDHLKDFVPWLIVSVTFLNILVFGVAKRSEYIARDELLKLLEVLRRAEKDSKK